MIEHTTTDFLYICLFESTKLSVFFLIVHSNALLFVTVVVKTLSVIQRPTLGNHFVKVKHVSRVCKCVYVADSIFR